MIGAEKGSIAVMGALSLVSLLGMSGLAVEVGNGYAAKIRNQRVADVAALGAAVAYRAASQSLTVAQATATDIVVANGLASSTATVSQVTVNGQSGIQVSVTTTVPVKLASMISSSSSYSVTNSAVASLVSNSSAACLTALGSSGNTVSVTGGTSITASNCAINSNGTVYSSNISAKVTAKQIVASAINDTANSYGAHAITTTPTANNIQTTANAASDFVKSNTAVQTALCYVNKLTGGTDTYDATTNPYGYAGGNTACTTQLLTPATYASGSSTDWTTGYKKKAATGFDSYEVSDYSCSYIIPAGTYVVRNLTIGGGCSVVFDGPSTLTFNSITMNGALLTFGDGDIIVANTFSVNGNTTVTMGNGLHSFGTLSIGGGKSLSLGTGNFNVTSGGISLSGGAFLKANVTTGNTVVIGGSITVGGSSYLCFTALCATPTADTGGFSVDGGITTSGGSTLVINKAATHVINGNFSLNGSSTLGSGLYVIKGNFTNNTGGTMTGQDVTFALGGTFTLSGGTLLDLAAPSASSSYGITDILVATKSNAATSIGGGSQDKYSGLFYAPNSAMSMSGGTSLSSNGSQCLMLVVNSLSLSGSATTTESSCSSQNSSTGGTVSLLQ